MGLTHHWERPIELPPDRFAAAVRDVERVVAASGVPVAGFEGSGPPLFRDDVIVFNGVAPAACEPFEIHQTEFDRRGRPKVFSFCKTQRAPYDLCVRLALIVLKHHLGEQMEVGSDDRADDWAAARGVCQSALGYGSGFRLRRE